MIPVYFLTVIRTKKIEKFKFDVKYWLRKYRAITDWSCSNIQDKNFRIDLLRIFLHGVFLKEIPVKVSGKSKYSVSQAFGSRSLQKTKGYPGTSDF
jgi:hypothetical protein